MTLKEIQSRTFGDMLSCLEVHGTCCVERPTGFGKTKLFMDYVKRYPNSKFLYVYDMESTKVDILNKYKPTNVSFISYAAISRKEDASAIKQKICGEAWHTIIFDEAHLMGGANIMKVLDEVIPLAIKSGVRVLGGTATRLRTDLVDVSKHFFHEHGVDEYTMLDAVRDGIMQEPYWTLTAHYKELLSQLRKNLGALKNAFVTESLRQLDRAYANIDGVSSVYAKTVSDVYGSIPDRMRFIVFYPTIKAINDNCQRDVTEFSKAFPEHEVVWAALSNSSQHASTITEIESLFSSTGKQVQLIFAVNMLNQAYHSDLLTGIVMYRATFSNIIFTQQLGRIMSVTSKRPGIVFDNVGNALIKPERAMATLQQIQEDETRVKSGVPTTRGHMDVRLHATQELIDFQKVYARIQATREITQEQIEVAKRNWMRHKSHLPTDVFEKLSGVPIWVVDEDA